MGTSSSNNVANDENGDAGSESTVEELERSLAQQRVILRRLDTWLELFPTIPEKYAPRTLALGAEPCRDARKIVAETIDMIETRIKEIAEVPHRRKGSSGMDSKSDSDNEDDSEAAPSTHPDDVLQGEPLRTPDILNNKVRADSFYLVYSARSKLVKIGVTLYTYEECFQKYTKLYGHLDSFHFLKIENDMTRERLERACYQFFSETRMYTGKEFFQPFDSHGRLMVPLYLSLLTQLTSSDLHSIRRFYLMHGTTALAAKQWIEAQHHEAAVQISPEEVAALSGVRIISTAATSQLSRAVEQAAAGGGDWVHADEFDSSSDSESGDDDEDGENGTAKHAAQSTTSMSYAQQEELLSESSAEEGGGDTLGDLQDRLLTDSRVKQAGSALPQKHTQALAPPGENISLYLVHSVRADLVKVGFTTGMYEECKKKFTTVYGHLDGFFYFAVENDLLTHKSTRLEKVFYRLFSETRTTPDGPFFSPRDRLGRNMIPLYVTVLKDLASVNTAHATQFYRKHREPSAMHTWMEMQHSLHSPSAAVPLIPSPGAALPSQPSPTSLLPPAALNFAYQNSAPPAVTIAKNSSGALSASKTGAVAAAAATTASPTKGKSHTTAAPPPLPTGSFEASDLEVEDL